MSSAAFSFVDRNGVQQMATSTDALFAAIARGDLTRESQLYDPAIGAWQPAGTVPFVAPCFGGPAPLRPEDTPVDPQIKARVVRRQQLTLAFFVLAHLFVWRRHPGNFMGGALGLLFLQLLFFSAPYRWGWKDREWKHRVISMGILAALQAVAVFIP